MKRKVVLTLCVAFVLGSFSSAYAQLVAGSPEDKAFEKILAEANPDAKATLLLDYEKQFPQSKVLPDIYGMLMEVYRQKNDTAKVIEFGEKVIKIDQNNVTALMAVSRNYSLERKNLEVAVQYAQRAVESVAKMRSQAPPANFTADTWKTYLDSTDQAAKSILAYAQSLHGR
jgi:hypothetical protein